MFKDINNLNFIKHGGETYRTQQKEKNNDDTVYVDLPENIDKYYTPQYAGVELLNDSILSSFYKQLEIPFYEKLDWSLPDYTKELAQYKLDIPRDRKIAIIKLNTARREWLLTTRQCQDGYLSWCCKILKDAGYYTISICDIQENQEWITDKHVVDSDLKLHKGELGIYGTLELIRQASCVVSSSSFSIPACVSTQTPLFLILGGRLMYDGISKTLHPSMDLNKIHYSQPTNPCRCSLNEHNCNKKIDDLDIKFFDFLRSIQKMDN